MIGFHLFFYVDKKAKFSNKLEIKCQTKSKPVNLRLSESYDARDMVKHLKSIKFEPNTYLPYCSLDYAVNPPIIFKNFKEIYDHVRDLYVKDNIFFGGGIKVSLVESGLYHLFDTNKVAGKKFLEEFFINNNEELFHYKNDYKFWYDDRFSKVKFWKEVKFYDNQFLVLFR